VGNPSLRARAREHEDVGQRPRADQDLDLADAFPNTSGVAANFQRLRGGRVVEHWTTVDVFGTLQDLRS
jgi:hypothetical protein